MTALRDLARAILAEVRGDADEAVRLLMKRLGEDPALYEDVIRPIIEDAVRREAAAARPAPRTVTRATAKTSTNGTAPVSATVEGLRLKGERALLEWQMQRAGGVLGDATHTDLDMELGHLRRQFLSIHALIRFYERLFVVLPRGQRVRDAFSEIALRDMMREASK